MAAYFLSTVPLRRVKRPITGSVQQPRLLARRLGRHKQKGRYTLIWAYMPTPPLCGLASLLSPMTARALSAQDGTLPSFRSFPFFSFPFPLRLLSTSSIPHPSHHGEMWVPRPWLMLKAWVAQDRSPRPHALWGGDISP